MSINVVQATHTLALIGCGILILTWLLFSRRFLGFLYMLIGLALLIAAIRCNGDLHSFGSAALGIGFCGGLVLIIYALTRTRRRREQIPVYYTPAEQRRRR
jgi:peptidoglycan/LPS O-acetylase OafA/YrhL